MSTRRPSRHTRSARIQGLSALLVIAFLGSSLGSFVHKATERHARCPEHGEVIHVSSASGLAAAAVELAGAPADGLGAVARTPADNAAGHEHEHCYLCPTSRERVGLVAAHSLLLPIHAASSAATPSSHAAPPSLALYLLAPKTSPPV